ncbi:MAG: cell division protein ZapA [Candidatus Delongbacteria bacterium]|jgi:cell division protein ZapA (FtsZ GTPase activity inhibitor)|nr:cell division protein ZapA [Candidatus Delongbacteria bacterium]MDD4205281.1 cell division protein ZapA [Candidatus Delongbacteria bacterium]MDY0017972.1 cell division protein ZapA [Candidatus Delongbacteria bacterium]
MTSSFKVNILGEEFSVKVNTEQDDYTKDVVNHVIEKMEEVKNATNENSTKRIAVLAALNITAEFLKRDRSYRDNLKDIEKILGDIGL